MKIAGRIDKAGNNLNPSGKQKLVIMLDKDEPETPVVTPPTGADLLEEDVSYPQMVVMAKRLNKFIKEEYGSKSAFIEKLEISSEDAIQYFSYKKPLGIDVLTKISGLGCDINWLLTGVSSSTPDNSIKIDTSVEHLNYEVYSAKLDNVKHDLDKITDSIELLNETIEKIESSFQKKLDDYVEKLVTYTVRGVEEQVIKNIKKAMFENLAAYQKSVSGSAIKIDDITEKIKEFIKTD